MTRRDACCTLLGMAALPLAAQNAPDSFRAYTDAPRLLLRPARLKLLRREKERRSLRWDQFETLWTGGATFPELGFAQALHFQIDDDRESAVRAVAWAVGPGDDIRQIALIADWCDSVMSRDDRTQIQAKLRRAMNDPKPIRTIADARSRLFAAVVLSDAQPAESERAIQAIFDAFWMKNFVASLHTAKGTVANADSYALLELLHVFRDNLNFDLRETFPAWFAQYPIMHMLAHYPAPWPGSENEFRIPADEAIEKAGPDVRKATMSRAAELAMVAYDSNVSSSQLLQGWLTNDRFLLRGTLGIAYEFLWANPYQPGLSYYHAPLSLHDSIGGQLFVRSSWEDDASWLGFFSGQLQKFDDGQLIRVDPRTAKEPLDIDQAIVFFARENRKFTTPSMKADEAVNVFIVGLDPGRPYHLEVDGEEMFEERADPGGIVNLPVVLGQTGVRLAPKPGA